MNINPLNHLIIEPDDRQNRVICGGVEILINDRINNTDFNVQSGTVIAVPSKKTFKKNIDNVDHWFDMPFLPGDKVFFGPNIVQPYQPKDHREKYEVGEGDNWHKLPLGGVFFGIRDGEFILNANRILTKPLAEDRSKFLKSIDGPNGKVELITNIDGYENPRHKLQEGIIFKISPEPPEGWEPGEGDRVYFKVHSDIPIEVDGEKMFIQMFKDIFAYEFEGEMRMVSYSRKAIQGGNTYTRGDHVIVEADEQGDGYETGFGLYVVRAGKKGGFQSGTVRNAHPRSELTVGDRVLFKASSDKTWINNQLVNVCETIFDVAGVF